MADDTGTQSSLLGLITSGLQFATPFAQAVLNQKSTPSQVQGQRLKDASLNGSGPNDPNLAGQSPLGLTDFLTGQHGSQNTPQSGTNIQGTLTFVGIAAVAILVVVMILKR